MSPSSNFRDTRNFMSVILGLSFWVPKHAGQLSFSEWRYDLNIFF